MEQLSRTFQACASDGSAFTIELWTQAQSAANSASPAAVPPISGGVLRTAGGRKLTRRRKGEYEIFGWGIILTCSDPDAP